VDVHASAAVAWRKKSVADALAPGAALTLESCTVIGKVHTRQLTLASDCLFVGALAAGGDTWKAPLWR